jgi:hypothetical protein
VLALAVAVVVAVVEHEASFSGVFEASDFAEEFRAFAGEHGTVDDLDSAGWVHNLIYKTFWR